MSFESNFWRLASSGPHWIRGLLWLFSLCYRGGVRMRYLAYERGWAKSQKVAIPVISVGNIAVGGTGKTPLVLWLAQEVAKDKKVAIVSRGYRGEWEHALEPVRLNDSHTPLQSGDEPYLLARALPSVDVWVGKDRCRAASCAIEAGAEILLLDDGMQHLRLARDVEIVALDGKDLWGGGALLPRGRLRDLPERLSEADLIVINHIDDLGHALQAEKEVRLYSEAPVVSIRPQLQVPTPMRGKPVGVFCALGRPERFLAQLAHAGLEVVHSLIGADHRPFAPSQLMSWAEQCLSLGSVALVCTEKDAVKLPKDLTLPLPVVPLGLQLEIVRGKLHWSHLLRRLSR